MIIVTHMGTSQKILKFALLFIVSTAVYSCALKPTVKSMDISDFIEKKDDLEKFINENFDSVEYKVPSNPLFFYRVNLINKTESLKFCTMNIQQCWVNKIDTLYGFFILIKTSAEIEKNISKIYGKWETRSEGNIDGHSLGDEFSWSAGKLKIDVSSYSNPLGIPKYDMCKLVMCNKMTINQLLQKPHTEK